MSTVEPLVFIRRRKRIKSFCIVLPMQKLGWTERGGERPSNRTYGIFN
jgi:hypothetical protein